MDKTNGQYIGNEGEQVIVFPKKILQKCSLLPLIRDLYINRMGFFPNAADHYYYRKPDVTPYAVLIHCSDGEGWVKTGQKRIVLGPGDAFFLPSYSEHSYGASPHAPWSIYWMHISGKNTKDLEASLPLNKKGLPVHTLHSDERTRIFNKIFRLFSNGFSASNLLCANLMLPSYLSSFISPESYSVMTPEANLAESKTQEAIYYMQEQITQKITIEQMAKHLGMSVPFFFKRFKRETGYSPIAYFNSLKIQKAIQLIHTEKYYINEISFMIGIDDPYYFSRLFKKQMGVSPKKYMKEFIIR